MKSKRMSAMAAARSRPALCFHLLDDVLDGVLFVLVEVRGLLR